MKNAFLFIIFLFFLSCNLNNGSGIENTLKLSGDNSKELKKVIDYYANNPDKLKAAYFLVKNMSMHVSQDSNVIDKNCNLYDEYMGILNKYNYFMTSDCEKNIDDFCLKNKLNLKYSNMRYDVKNIKSDWLINEIDRSFIAWKENKFTKKCSLEEFCYYILPYSFVDGLVLDNFRDTVFARHKLHFDDNYIDFKQACDSLLFKYSFLRFKSLSSNSLPIYSASVFEKLKRGTCEDKAWFNCLLISALGMAVTIDFIPGWGNRNGKHTWNSLIVDGVSYPFEPFWDSNRWKYKQVYNNLTVDVYRGKFRLPKVYRRTYEHHINELIVDKSISRNDIPILFTSPFVKDVSTEYFSTRDVKVEIVEKIPRNTKYCYLCVFNYNQWVPVQWGKIDENKNVVFEDMGMDIIYLPMFCLNGVLTPAASPFYLNQDGKSETITPNYSKSIDISVNNFTSYLDPKEIVISKSLLKDSHLIGFDECYSNSGDTIYTFADDMDVWNNTIQLRKKKKYRYIHLIPANFQIGLSEISFFEYDVCEKLISGVVAISDVIPIDSRECLKMVYDNLSVTGFRGLFPGQKEKERGIIFDLGKSYSISSIHFSPYSLSSLSEGSDYELYYWDNQWIFAGKVKGSTNYVTFKNIPEGTIYKMHHKNNDIRMFKYYNGIVQWF